MSSEKQRKLVLASASPRRHELLASVGLSFEVLPADIDEEGLPMQETPAKSAEFVAQRKAAVIAQRYPEAVVLSADTMVVLPEQAEILNKPRSPEDAVSMLRRLRARSHEVITGYCICCHEAERIEVAHVKTEVHFMPLSDEQIQGYVATGHPLDKAGAYGIQETGAFLVRQIIGSYTNVVGLPVAEVVSRLSEWGIWTPDLLAKQ